MAKLQNIGNTVIITSEMTLNGINKLKKYNPKALQLVETDDEGEKEVTFVVTTGAAPSVSKYGICFTASTADGHAVFSCARVGDTSDDIKEELADKFGVALVKLGKMEASFAEALASVEADHAAVLENIEVL